MTYVDQPFENEEDIQREALRIKNRMKDSFFLDGEKEKIIFPVQNNVMLKASKAQDVVEDKLKRKVMRKDTLENCQKSLKLLGLLQAKVAMECGKDYENKLNSFPEDEEFREEKAAFLHIKGADGQAGKLSQTFKDFQHGYYGELNHLSDEIMKDSPIPNVDALKKMTLGEFLDAGYNSPREQEKFYADSTKDGIPCSSETNAYEYYKAKLNRIQRDRKAADPEYEIEPVTDADIYANAKSRYTRDLMRELTNVTTYSVRDTLSRKDKETFDRGMELLNRKEYEPPKQLEDWVKNTGQPMLLNRRADTLNECFLNFQQKVDQREPYNLENETPFRKFYGNDLGPNADEYGKFIQSHVGAKAMLDDREKRREHLSLVMAAQLCKGDQPGNFNLTEVQKTAKELRKKDIFKNYSDREVLDALKSRGNAIEAFNGMMNKKYGVPKEKREEYIRQMKELSESMVPAKGQSAKYVAMKNAVDEVAALDPADPLLESKLNDANKALLESTLDYNKGKKSLRSYKDSQARFDNSLDVMSVFNTYVPGLRRFAKQVADRTNAVRKAKPGDDAYVDLSKYGVERALSHAPKNAPAYKRAANVLAGKWVEEADFLDPEPQNSAVSGPVKG